MSASQQQAVELLARAVQHLERDIPAIYRRAASLPLVSPEAMAEMTGAVIRCMEYSRGLFLQAQALSHGDQELRARIASSAGRGPDMHASSHVYRQNIL